MNIYQMSHGAHTGLPLASLPLNAAPELQLGHSGHAGAHHHPAGLGGPHHHSMFPGPPQMAPHGQAAPQQVHPNAGLGGAIYNMAPPPGPSGSTGGGGSGAQAANQSGGSGGPGSGAQAANQPGESPDQQKIRVHKHLVMLLKNGSMKTTVASLSKDALLEQEGAGPEPEDENRIDSPWVRQELVVTSIINQFGCETVHPAILSQTLSDFKPAIAEKEVDDTRYVQLRQHREISLNVETDFRLGEEGSEDATVKKYRIVDEHARLIVDRMASAVRARCGQDGRQVTTMVNRNVVTFFAEPGITGDEWMELSHEMRTAKGCSCPNCSRISPQVRYRCIINDNVLARLLEATAGAPLPYVPNSGPSNGLQRSPLEVSMAGLNISVPPHSVHDPSAAAGMAYGPYVSLGAMAGSDSVLVSSQPSQSNHGLQNAFYSHAGQTHGLPHSMPASASQMFAGQPLLTIPAQQLPAGAAAGLGQGQSGLIGWAQGQPGAGQQGQPGGGLQSPEYLFSNYNVASINAGYSPSLPSPSPSGHHQASAAHHQPQHHFVGVSRHASGGGATAQAALGRHGAAGPPLGGPGPGMGPGKGLVSAPQKEKNLPPRLQSQNRQAAAAAAAAAASGNPGNYGYEGFIFNGPTYGSRGNGRRGGSGFARARNQRGYNHFMPHHQSLPPTSLPPAAGLGAASSGASMAHPNLPPPAPTPPDLTTDFPHLPGPAGPQRLAPVAAASVGMAAAAAAGPSGATAAAVVAGTASSGGPTGGALLTSLVTPTAAASAPSAAPVAPAVSANEAGAAAGSAGIVAPSQSGSSPQSPQQQQQQQAAALSITYADAVSNNHSELASSN